MRGSAVAPVSPGGIFQSRNRMLTVEYDVLYLEFYLIRVCYIPLVVIICYLCLSLFVRCSDNSIECSEIRRIG